jgi:predicted lipid-binding transport protein (Tim44 family)
MHGGMMAGMGLGMLAWAMFALVFLVVTVLGVVALVRYLSTPSTPGTQTGPQHDQTFPPQPPDRTPP